MAELKTSFIPQKPIIPREKGEESSSINLLVSLSFIIFLVVLLTAGGLYFYKVALEQRIETMSQSLDRAREAIEPELVTNLKRLDDRIRVSDSLIHSHKVLFPVFKFLENATLQSVQFSQLTYTLIPTGEATISLTGKARGYASLALQSDALGAGAILEEPIFSNLGLDREGNVAFNLSSAIDEKLLLYGNNLAVPSAVPSTNQQ